MKNTSLALAVVGLSAAVSMPGCLFIDGSSSSSSYRGYGSTTRVQLDAIVAANTQNRIGEPSAVVLGRFPAENISLVHSSVVPSGADLAIYRVFAREKHGHSRFERYLAFENDHLVLLTDDEDNITVHFGPGVQVD